MADLEAQIQSAKAFLLKSSSESKNNLYDHLTNCISVILQEQTANAVDFFENISETVKKEKLQANKDTIQDQLDPSDRVNLAENQKTLFEKADQDVNADDDEEVSIPFQDLMEVARCFEAGGIGLGKEEFFLINLAIKQMTQRYPLVSAMFWGKVFGTRANYIIAEAEFQEGEGEDDEEEDANGEEPNKEDSAMSNQVDEEEGSDIHRDEPPKSQWKPPPIIPKEEPKTGVNKKTYFVCNIPGDPWVKLPHVTPAQIVVSRQINKAFTGNLNTPMITFPLFPGKEMNYLRCQIARITSTTHISPIGYFQTLEEEEEDEDQGSPTMIESNPDFEVDKMLEFSDISNWCHHIPYLLHQGRTVWWNPVQKADDEFEEEEVEDTDEKEQPDDPEPENGPPILTSAAEDAKIDGMPAWTTRISSTILPHYAVAIASSNLWPGAHTVVSRKKCENIYIGWGLKYSARPFNPTLPPPAQDEFPMGTDVTEIADPSAEQEQAQKLAQQIDMEEEEEEEEEEESDEED